MCCEQVLKYISFLSQMFAKKWKFLEVKLYRILIRKKENVTGQKLIAVPAWIIVILQWKIMHFYTLSNISSNLWTLSHLTPPAIPPLLLIKKNNGSNIKASAGHMPVGWVFPRSPWWNGVRAEHHTGHMWRQAWHEWPTGGSVCLSSHPNWGGSRAFSGL